MESAVRLVFFGAIAATSTWLNEALGELWIGSEVVRGVDELTICGAANMQQLVHQLKTYSGSTTKTKLFEHWHVRRNPRLS